MPSEASYRDILGNITWLSEIRAGPLPAALSNGFGPESMVLTDLIHPQWLHIENFSLDTNRAA